MNEPSKDGLKPSPIILGLWPIAGITTVDATPDQSRATIKAAIDCGITTFDSAFSYGYDGESDRLLAEFIGDKRSSMFIISKVGQRWNAQRQRVVDAQPSTMQRDLDTVLHRLGTDYLDLLMLHSVDPEVDIRDCAEALQCFREQGLVKQIGVCNVTTSQLAAFTQVTRPYAVQLPVNILQPETLADVIPWCQSQRIDVHAYWVLMKGLLAGRIGEHHVFAAGDSRPKYDIYQGAKRQRAHRLLAGLQPIADQNKLTVSQLSVGWVLSQPGVNSVILGAKRPEQIQETAVSTPLRQEILLQINEVIAELD